MSLTYSLTATLTVASSASSTHAAPQASTTHVEAMEIHLCPSGPSIEDFEDGDVRPALMEVSTPISSTPVKVGLPRTRLRRTDVLPMWVEVPVPESGTLERGHRLKNVRAELHRVVSVAGAEKASTSAFASSSDGPQPNLSSATNSDTILTSTGASCRFSPISPIRLRLSLHPPLSPSSAYQSSCGHLTQSTRNLVGRDGKGALETRFYVKVFIGLAPQEVEVEREIEIVGDLELDESDEEGEAAGEEEERGRVGRQDEEAAPPVPPEPSFPPSKEPRWAGETFRESSRTRDEGPSGSGGQIGTSSGEDPPPFLASDPFPVAPSSLPPPIHLDMDVVQHPAISTEPSHPQSTDSTPIQPPPFSELPPFQAHAATPPMSDGPAMTSPRAGPPPTFLESEASTSSSSSVSGGGGHATPPLLFPFIDQRSAPRSSPLANSSALPPPPLPTQPQPANPASLPPTWIEFDGYESFSEPPPPLSISLHTTSSVDPPREGEVATLPVAQMEEMIHSLTIESGAVPLAAGARVDDPQDLPPIFEAAGPATGRAEGGVVRVDESSAAEAGGGSGGDTALPPSYAGGGAEGSGGGATRLQEEPPMYS